MNRQQVYKEIEETLGLVPGFLKAVPDSSLELEWQTMARGKTELLRWAELSIMLQGT